MVVKVVLLALVAELHIVSDAESECECECGVRELEVSE